MSHAGVQRLAATHSQQPQNRQGQDRQGQDRQGQDRQGQDRHTGKQCDTADRLPLRRARRCLSFGPPAVPCYVNGEPSARGKARDLAARLCPVLCAIGIIPQCSVLVPTAHCDSPAKRRQIKRGRGEEAEEKKRKAPASRPTTTHSHAAATAALARPVGPATGWAPTSRGDRRNPSAARRNGWAAGWLASHAAES